MKTWYHNLKTNWSEVLNDRKFLAKFAVNFIACYAIYMSLVHFLIWNSSRPGVVLGDPIQKLFIPKDFSSVTFFLTYLCIVSFIVYVAARPKEFYYGARAFTAVFVARVAFIYLVPLTPPVHTIPLKDPFLDNMIWGNVEITNDLFFSGHVTDICVFFFLCRVPSLKYFYLACIPVVALLLVWQHVHYTADVIASPFFAYSCYAFFAKGQIKSLSAVNTMKATNVFSGLLSGVLKHD